MVVNPNQLVIAALASSGWEPGVGPLNPVDGVEGWRVICTGGPGRELGRWVCCWALALAEESATKITTITSQITMVLMAPP